MQDGQEDAVNADLRVPDIVRLKYDTVFWDAYNSEDEEVKKAGTEYPVIDVFDASENKKGYVILEDYDPLSKRNWIASVGIDEVELVRRWPR